MPEIGLKKKKKKSTIFLRDIYNIPVYTYIAHTTILISSFPQFPSVSELAVRS